jgi:hypothetical protein
MSSDEVLRSLARVAREESANEAELDPRWAKLALGELGDADVAALERFAESDPEAEEKLAAYRPMGEEEKERLAARIVSVLAEGKGARGLPIVNLAPRPRRAPRAWQLGIAAGLALAAGFAVWSARVPSAPVAMTQGDALPAYALVTSSGDRATRGAEAPPSSDAIEVAPDSTLDVLLRPATVVKGPVSVRAFLAPADGGAVRDWAPELRVSADGAIAIQGTAGELLGAPEGTWDLVFALGRPSDLPGSAEAVGRALAGSETARRWQLLVRRVRLAPQ